MRHALLAVFASFACLAACAPIARDRAAPALTASLPGLAIDLAMKGVAGPWLVFAGTANQTIGRDLESGTRDWDLGLTETTGEKAFETWLSKSDARALIAGQSLFYMIEASGKEYFAKVDYRAIADAAEAGVAIAAPLSPHVGADGDFVRMTWPVDRPAALAPRASLGGCEWWTAISADGRTWSVDLPIDAFVDALFRSRDGALELSGLPSGGSRVALRLSVQPVAVSLVEREPMTMFSDVWPPPSCQRVATCPPPDLGTETPEWCTPIEIHWCEKRPRMNPR
jgi:hypothetical protein